MSDAPNLSVEELLAKLDAMFAPLPKDRRAGIHAEFVRQLRRYEGEVLARACDDVLDAWTKTLRPMPAEFRMACQARKPSPSTPVAAPDAKITQLVQRAQFVERETALLVTRTLEYEAEEIRRRRHDAGPGVDASVFMLCVALEIARKSKTTWVAQHQAPPHVMTFTDAEWGIITGRAESRTRSMTSMSHFSGFIPPKQALNGKTNRRDDWKSRGRFVKPAPVSAPPKATAPHSAPEPPPLSEDEFEAAHRREIDSGHQADEKTGISTSDIENGGSDEEKFSPPGGGDDELSVI